MESRNAFSHLPFVSTKKIFSTVGVTKGVLTRIPNAAGLIFESMAATENLYFYYDDSAKNIG